MPMDKSDQISGISLYYYIVLNVIMQQISGRLVMQHTMYTEYKINIRVAKFLPSAV